MGYAGETTDAAVPRTRWPDQGSERDAGFTSPGPRVAASWRLAPSGSSPAGRRFLFATWRHGHRLRPMSASVSLRSFCHVVLTCDVAPVSVASVITGSPRV